MADLGVQLEFGAMPRLARTLPRLFLARKPNWVRDGATVPRIEARLEGVTPEAEKLAAYRAVCGFAAGPHLPVTLPHVLAMPLHLEMLTHAAFPIGLMGVVHVRNLIVQHRPIKNAELLGWQCVIEGHRDTERGQEFELWTRVRAGDELVWEECCTFLARRRDPAARERRERAKERPRDNAGAPGTRLTSFVASGDVGRRYGWVSGDFNPIHLGALAARAFGFPRAVAHGMWTLARCCAELEPQWPAGKTRVEVEFKLPVLLPSRLRLQSRADGAVVDFELRDDAGQKPHIIGRIAPSP